MATCALCPERPEDTEMLEHLRLFHPDVYGDGPDLWPDGRVVIVDETLEPDEFQDAP